MLRSGVVPYTSNHDLPLTIQTHLPRHAQEIYRAAFNDAFDRYGPEREAIAHRIAWAAVKRHYSHHGIGIWVPRARVA